MYAIQGDMKLNYTGKVSFKTQVYVMNARRHMHVLHRGKREIS